MDQTIQRHVDTLWHYMQCHEAPRDADCLLVLGGRDDRVAVYAAALAKQFTYGIIMVSGGVAEHNPSLAQWGEETEAAHFAGIMRRHGVTRDILIENEAKNTGQNAVLGHAVLQKAGKTIPRTIQLVAKSYLERRAKATFEVQWPGTGAEFYVASPHKSFEEYVNDEHDATETVQQMVGYMNRILVYPRLGYQSHQDVPEAVMQAYEALIAAGFTKYLLEN